MRTGLLLLFLLLTGLVQAQVSVEERIQTILIRLEHVAGVSSQAVRLEVGGQDSQRIAYLDRRPGSTPRLAFDRRLYEQCVDEFGPTRGEALLAFVIGHELAHARLNHQANRSFAEKTTVPKLPERLSQRQEVAADSLGLLLAYLAGYDPQADLPRFFKKMYGKWYPLIPNLPGYPPLAERQRVLQRHAPTFRQLARVFQAGQLLYAFGEWDPAAQCFAQLTGQGYFFREILLDQAACRLQQLLTTGLPAPVRAFALPVEWDSRNRLDLQDQRSPDSDQIRRAAWFREAEECLDHALRLAPAYGPARLNRAVAYLLAGKYHGGLSQFETGAISGEAALLSGIAWLGLNDPAKARPWFDRAVALKGYEAKFNRQVFEWKTGKAPRPRLPGVAPRPPAWEKPPARNPVDWDETNRVLTLGTPLYLRIEVPLQKTPVPTFRVKLEGTTLELVWHETPTYAPPGGLRVGAAARKLPPATGRPRPWGSNGRLHRFGSTYAALVRDGQIRAWLTCHRTP